ncbi:MAG: SGNH/GDSL hydrolase family protein [Candidatus Acidiferrales bacterium]
MGDTERSPSASNAAPAREVHGSAIQRADKGETMGRTVLAFYLAHLVVPLLMLVDALSTWHEWWPNKSGLVELGIAIIWLVLGVSCVAIGSLRRHLAPRLPRFLLLTYSVYISLGVGELLVRRMDPYLVRPNPGIYQPGASWSFVADPSFLPGVSGTKRFTVNELGLRGPKYPVNPQTYRIIAIGGSTTQCAHLDDSEAWPQLVMEELNAQQHTVPVWVNNAGVAGQTTVDNLYFFRSLPALQKADAYIFLIGLNDLQATLTLNGGPSQKDVERQATAFLGWVATRTPQYPLFMRLALVRLLSNALSPFRRQEQRTQSTMSFGLDWLKYRRGLRATLPTLPLPDLTVGLAEYRARVMALADECQRRSTRCIFLTQPMMWREGLSPKETSVLFFGWIGLRGTYKTRYDHPDGFASVGDLAHAIDLYNKTLLDVCSKRFLECYDLASVVPLDTTAFFDDTHFNENGTRIVSQFIAEKLLQRPPLLAEPRQAELGSH